MYYCVALKFVIAVLQMIRRIDVHFGHGIVIKFDPFYFKIGWGKFSKNHLYYSTYTLL